MTNNYLKRHHLPKFSRHCVYKVRIKLSNDDLRYSFNDVKSLHELFNTIMNDVEKGIINQQFNKKVGNKDVS